jgi:hypothetical protein
MNLFKTSILTSCLLFAFKTYSQDVRQYNNKSSFWSELNFIGNISKKFAYQLDFQYRFQSQQQSYQSNANLNNIFLNPYQTVFRPWIHYYPNKDRKIRLSISPIGFWGTFGLAGSNGTTKAAGEAANDNLLEYPEIRSTYQLTTYDKIGRVAITYRFRYELRWVGNGQPSTPVYNKSGFDFFHGMPMVNATFKERLRIFFRTDVPFKGTTIDAKELYFAWQNELWIGLGKKTANSNFLDQNRAYAAIGYKLPQEIRIEIGYLNQIVPQSIYTANGKNIRNMDCNNALQIYVFFDNFNRFFKKKSKDVSKDTVPEETVK